MVSLKAREGRLVEMLHDGIEPVHRDMDGAPGDWNIFHSVEWPKLFLGKYLGMEAGSSMDAGTLGLEDIECPT